MNFGEDLSVGNDSSWEADYRDCMANFSGKRAPDPPQVPKNLTDQIPIGEPTPVPDWEIALKVISYVIIIVIGTVGNFSVILIVARHKRMRNMTNIYVMNLAVADLLMILFCTWPHLGNHITVFWPFGSFVCQFNYFFQLWFLTTSVFLLTLVAADRFFAIVFPLGTRMGTKLSPVLLALVWIAAGLVASPYPFVWRMFTIYWLDVTEIWCREVWPSYYYWNDFKKECDTHMPGQRTYVIIVVVLIYFVPIVLVTGMYSMVVYKLWKRPMGDSQNAAVAMVHQRTRRKVVRMLVAVLVAFIVCWTPNQVLWLWDHVRERNESLPSYMHDLKYAANFLAYTNSAINPILYGGFNENFRRGFKEVFKCRIFKFNRVGTEMQVTNTWQPGGEQGTQETRQQGFSQAPSVVGKEPPAAESVTGTTSVVLKPNPPDTPKLTGTHITHITVTHH